MENTFIQLLVELINQGYSHISLWLSQEKGVEKITIETSTGDMFEFEIIDNELIQKENNEC